MWGENCMTIVLSTISQLLSNWLKFTFLNPLYSSWGITRSVCLLNLCMHGESCDPLRWIPPGEVHWQMKYKPDPDRHQCQGEENSPWWAPPDTLLPNIPLLSVPVSEMREQMFGEIQKSVEDEAVNNLSPDLHFSKVFSLLSTPQPLPCKTTQGTQ